MFALQSAILTNSRSIIQLLKYRRGYWGVDASCVSVIIKISVEESWVSVVCGLWCLMSLWFVVSLFESLWLWCRCLMSLWFVLSLFDESVVCGVVV
jgi:hypothetical protein